ncbi:MAG: hypothetical protein ACK55I_25585, partial [bacterium]
MGLASAPWLRQTRQPATGFRADWRVIGETMPVPRRSAPARPPGAEEDAEVGAPDQPVVVEVGGRACRRGAPCAEERAEVRAVDGAVAVQVRGARV